MELGGLQANDMRLGLFQCMGDTGSQSSGRGDRGQHLEGRRKRKRGRRVCGIRRLEKEALSDDPERVEENGDRECRWP